MDTDSFIVHLKTDVYKEIAEDVEKRFPTSNFEIDRPLPIGKTNWTNERSIRWVNLEKICWIKSKNK